MAHCPKSRWQWRVINFLALCPRLGGGLSESLPWRDNIIHKRERVCDPYVLFASLCGHTSYFLHCNERNGSSVLLEARGWEKQSRSLWVLFWNPYFLSAESWAEETLFQTQAREISRITSPAAPQSVDPGMYIRWIIRHACVLSCFSRVLLFATLWTIAH